MFPPLAAICIDNTCDHPITADNGKTDRVRIQELTCFVSIISTMRRGFHRACLTAPRQLVGRWHQSPDKIKSPVSSDGAGNQSFVQQSRKVATTISPFIVRPAGPQGRKRRSTSTFLIGKGKCAALKLFTGWFFSVVLISRSNRAGCQMLWIKQIRDVLALLADGQNLPSKPDPAG